MEFPFDYFVLFAEMRTGSNFLETNLNEIEGLRCYGEAFNPHFIGYPKTSDICGVSQVQRDATPGALIKVIRDQEAELSGFRFFHDHDPRVLDELLADPRCGKIVLTRNPVESFVSWKIASQTGQWKLTDVRHKKTAKVQFEAVEFDSHLQQLQGFQKKILHSLQTSGQTAFYIGYEDINDVDVLNGLAAFLGVDGRLETVSKTLKKQNPSSLEDKVENFAEMQDSLARVDHFNLNQTPNFEPRRQAMVPGYVAADNAALLYMPIKSATRTGVEAWLAELEGVPVEGLTGDFSQKTLRQWKRKRPGHRSFTVLRHPVVRAHVAFCEKILSVKEGTFAEIRRTLRNTYDLPIPEWEVGPEYDATAHKTAFIAFLKFLKANLSGQTAIRVDPVWASQTESLKGLGGFSFPDFVLREDELSLGLAQLAAQVGTPAPEYCEAKPDTAFDLADIYDGDVEAAVKDAYQRDYMMFGFGKWQP